MDLMSISLLIIFLLSALLQFLAISTQRVSISLVFSLLNSASLCLTMFVLGFHWLALTTLFLIPGCVYFSLVKASLFMIDKKEFRPRRKESTAFFASTTIVVIFITLSAFSFLNLDTLRQVDNKALDLGAITSISSEFSILFLILALISLPTLVSVMLLIRQDKSPEARSVE